MPQTRKIISVVFFSIFLLSISSCGPSPQPETSLSDNPQFEADIVDWERLDWKFWRHSLAKAYFFNSIRPREPFSKYQKQTHVVAEFPPINLEEFQALPAEQKDLRRDKARRHWKDARKFKPVVDRGWELWTLSYDGNYKAVDDQVNRHEMGIVTPAIKYLRTAAAIDPSNPVIWYDLAFFAWLVGDQRLQQMALDCGLSALTQPVEHGNTQLWRSKTQLGLLRIRILLDKAWRLRGDGLFAEAEEFVMLAAKQMREDEIATYDEALEVNLLQALLAAGRGDIHEARQLAKDLPEMRLGKQSAKGMYMGNKHPMVKSNMEHVDSSFLRDWVWVMTFLRTDEKEAALARMPERNYRIEFPVRLNFRYWQDMGEALEHFAERYRSRIAYGFSILYRPYFGYYPLGGARGNSRVTDQVGSGQPYFLGYGHFFIGGSLYSYAANRVVAMDMAQDEKIRREIGEEGIRALSACIGKGLRPGSALALRGQVNYRLFRNPEAKADLEKAHAILTEQGRESSDVLRLLAVVHFQEEDYESSLEALERFVALDPYDGFGWRTMGVVLTNLERYEEAMLVMERALRIEKDSLEGYFNLGLLYLQTGDTTGAELMLSELDSRYPSDPMTAQMHNLVENMPAGPMEMAATQVEIHSSTGAGAWFPLAETSVDLNLMSQVPEQELKLLATELETQYEAHPDLGRRLLLARVYNRLSQWKKVQTLLGLMWPQELTREEARELLMADSHLGQVDRALEMARRLDHPGPPLPDAEFWALVAKICLDNGYEREGAAAMHTYKYLAGEWAEPGSH